MPTAGSNNPSVISQIAARYNFGIVPTITTQESMAKNGLPFGMGHFEMNGSIFTVTDFVVYNDGIVAVAEKTDWAEAFLQDITNWVMQSFGFREVTSGVRRLYGSTIIVDFETPQATCRLRNRFKAHYFPDYHDTARDKANGVCAAGF